MSAFGYFDVQPVDASTLANDLASLGYQGFAYLKAECKRNQALPWLVLNCPNLDRSTTLQALRVQRRKQPTLINTANAKDLQNKLGFVTCLARQVAERRGKTVKAEFLRNHERVLE